MVNVIRRFIRRNIPASTVDLSKTGPVAPFAPIDLNNPQQVMRVLDLAARIGGILVSNGTANIDAKTQIMAITGTYGVHFCHADITLNNITMYAQVQQEQNQPVSVFRVVPLYQGNFAMLSRIDRLIRKIQRTRMPLSAAEAELAELVATPSPYGFRTALLGWSTMAAAVAVLLGGGFDVAIISFITSLFIMAGSAWLGQRRLPLFFQNVYGGVIATMPAAIIFHLSQNMGLKIMPAQVIASGIVVMLAGLTLVQSLQDGITGAPVTGSARFFETMIFTAGIVAGVGLGIELSGALGITLPTLEAGGASFDSAPWLKILSGAVASAAYAVACYAEWNSVWISGVTAAAGSSIYYLAMLWLHTGPLVGVAAAATVIGLAGGILSRRFMIPPLITAVAGITPLLPGLSIYRSMYALMHDQMILGYNYLALALGTASALAAGVVFGEWIARKLRRPASISTLRQMILRDKL